MPNFLQKALLCYTEDQQVAPQAAPQVAPQAVLQAVQWGVPWAVRLVASNFTVVRVRMRPHFQLLMDTKKTNRWKYLISQLLLILWSYTSFAKGLGHKELFDLSVYTILVYGICTQWKNLDRLIPLLLLIALSMFFPSIPHLWGFCALLFYYVSPQSYIFVFLCLLFWILEICEISIDNILTITVIFVLTYIAFRFLKVAYKKVVLTISVIIVLLTIFDMPIFKAPIYVEDIDDSIYSTSKTFQKITNSPKWNNKDISSKVIRETSFYTKVDDDQPGILVFDIGYNGHNKHVDSTVWQQPVSWYSNQLIGNQYLLEAIRKDGGLWSNKGVTLSHNWQGELLSFPETFEKSQPLIVKYGKTIYLHDSDYCSSYLSNYQKNLLEELVGNTLRPNLVRLMNVFFLILLMVSICIHKKKYIRSVLPLVLFAIIYAVYIHPTDGDIRMVGEIKNSHENNKFDAVPKKIVYSGFNYVIGDKNTKILVVKSGKEAYVKQEKIVVAEENSVINYKGKKLKVTDIPIGDYNGIKDGRLWICDGKHYNSKIKIDNVILIATGSPGLQSWKELLK